MTTVMTRIVTDKSTDDEFPGKETMEMSFVPYTSYFIFLAPRKELFRDEAKRE